MEDSDLKNSCPPPKVKGGLFVLLAALLVLLGALLYPAFQSEMVQFSNDGPYGVISSDVWKLPGTFLGQWNDLNWLGNEDVAAPPNMTNLIRVTLGTLGFAKFDAFLATLFAGLCGGLFFRVIGGNWWVCAMGGIAVAFNSNNFSNACWGLGSRPLCFGGAMLALALVARGFGGRYSWLKVALVGIGAGLSIMEGYDLGAILCVYIALYTAFVTLFSEFRKEGETGNPWVGKKLFVAAVRILVIAGMTALASSYSLSSLMETQVKGVGVFEDKEVDGQRWDFSTQWSLPKTETLRILIPGLMGYRMDSPNGKGYWGSVGESPNYEAGGAGMPRFSGSGEYAGLLVVLLASWSVASLWRKKKNPFTADELRHIKFWSIVGGASLLLAYGRYAPFYQLVYVTPVFGMFRNPIKYLVPFHISLIILFGYALVGLCRAYLRAAESRGEPAEQRSWGTVLALGWRKLDGFDKGWTWGILMWTGFSILGLLIFLSSGTRLTEWMQKTGIEQGLASLNFQASMWEIMIYIALLMVGLVLMAFILGGELKGKRIQVVCVAMLLFMMFDLYRANQPWVSFYNYQQRFQKDDLLDTLIAKPKTGRVSALATGSPYSQALTQLYAQEWLQHELPHYNIPTLESWMEPRKGMDKIVFESAFATNRLRYWELTSTRYLVGEAGIVAPLNEAWDAEKKRFSENLLFTFEPVQGPRSVLARKSQEGPFALLEFSGAIDRLSLYSHWEKMSSAEGTLQRLKDPAFNPAQTLLVEDTPGADTDVPLCVNSPEPSSRLDYETYSPLKFTVNVKGVTKDSILLINDRYNPKWKAFVDGQPVEVLRCNFIARGIRLTPGDHRVEMRFEQETHFFFISLLVMLVGLPSVFIILRKVQSK